MPSRPTILTRTYYRVKPFVPERLRWALRRLRARRILEGGAGETWPINEAAGATPDGWPGWPDGKQFAVVLTHDVESQVGLDKVRALAELEMELGFRSSFNFIPEGGYRVPDELRHWLVGNGFEVGVHDLNHDGKLYSSREGFRKKAERINHYLKEWDAVGFRSGFMLRQLDWLHDLDVSYDASTFDTDPFEPQPDGAGNIFPFVVPNGAGSYIELPYTLPQDSTLFLLLRESTPETWLKKLDWLARKGGQALLNVHPDYVDFGAGDGASGSASGTFPAGHYRQFLETIRDQYQGRFWPALPRELAAFAKSVLPARPVRLPRRICMLTHSYYESDNRVMRYAETLAARGDTVDVIALRQSRDLPTEETIRGVRVIRVRDRFDKSTKGALGHLVPILRFMRACARWMKESHRAAPYDLLHIHNMPDFVVFAGSYAKRHGAKVILDIHDIVPEFYASKFEKSDRAPSIAVLKWLERASARFADHIIIANHLWRDRYAERTGTDGHCSAFINNVDSSVFVPAPRTRDDAKQIILFPGSLSWHQGVDIAIDAFKQVHAQLPQTEFHIYGDGITRPALVAQAKQAGLNGSVRFFESRSLREIARIMADADLGVVPKRAESFGDEAYSTKIMEFMAVGVPVVISSTTVDRFYFNDSVVRFFTSGDADALAREILFVLQHPAERQAMVTRAAAYAEDNCWNRRKDDYLKIVDRLCTR